jgi:general secretion pathway protein F
MQYEVRIFDAASGGIQAERREADSEPALRQALHAQGYTVLALRPVRSWRNLLAQASAPFDAVLFCEELRTLLLSGMSVVEAIDTLAGKEKGGDKQLLLAALRRQLQEGKPLSAALQASQHTFSPLLIASIRASERSSTLEQALDEYCRFESVGRELRRRVLSAAIYPAMVVSFGLVVSLFMLSYVVPRFARVYEDMAGAISIWTLLLMHTGAFMERYLPALLGGGVLLGAGLFLAWRRGLLRRWLLGTAGRIGLVRRQLRLYQLSSMYQTLSMLLRGGFTLSDAMPLAQQLILDPALQQRVGNARQQIMEGQRMSKAFDGGGLADSVTLRLLQVGERSGDLATILGTIAQEHRRKFVLFIERATRVVEPLLLMIVGTLVGAIIVIMYMPVFDLAGGLG